VTCTSCGTDNRTGAKFCAECGAALAAACPNCGSPIDANAKFCPECGTRVGDAAAARTPPPAQRAAEPEIERRLVSVLFADLVGFTTLAEGRDSEAVRELLGHYFERASEVVARYGGTVEKFIGDAVMAVWGTPVAHEDDGERAVRAALDLVDAVREIGAEAGSPALQARAGVLTGEATVTLGAQNQGMVAGDLVNTASRLQSVAEPGTVLVGEATRRAAEGAIAFEQVADQALKGKTTPVPAYQALRVVATVRGAVRTGALEPPFVGRETEFRLLRELFHATGRERRARLVSLTGQAGIGKSRIAWEFQKYLDGIQEVLWWHHGRSPAYGEGVTFWALGEMVRKRAGLAEGDDEATSRARITAMVAEYVSVDDERWFVEPALLALLGLDEAPSGGRDRLFAGWRLFLERLSESSTVVLVFEDIQWADDGLLDFIDHLLEWSRSYPILIVTLARPELLDRRPTWGAGARSSSLALGPLSEPEMRELLAGIVPGLPEPAIRSVLARADGIPLYAVETVRMLVADGRLEPDGDGRYRPTGKLANLEVPHTLQALIAARLDALDGADRSLLQDASILGKTFSVDALSAVSGAAPELLEPRLRALVARELLELDTDPASPERGQYRFVQALIREVAYATVARRDRRTCHLAAARFFESRGEDELAPVLASHYLDAYRASPEGPEGEAVRAQARIALRAAADRAIALGSYAGAVTYLEQALELGALEPRDEAELLERAGTAADLDGQYDRAVGLLTRATERWRDVGDTVRTGHATAEIALVLSNGGHSEQALEMLEAARTEFFGAENEVARAPIVARIGQMELRRGAGVPALQAAEEALPVAERHRMRQLIVDALITKSAALGYVGRYFEGIALMDGTLRMAADEGFVAQQLRAMNNAVVTRIDEDPWGAYELGLDAINQAQRFGIRPFLVFSAMNTSEIALRLGEWSRAESMIESVLALDVDPTDRFVVLCRAASLALCRGRRDDARLAEFHKFRPTGDDHLADANVADVRMVETFLDGDHAATQRISIERARTDVLNAPSSYERAGRAALWMGDVDAARVVVREFQELGRSAAFPVAELVATEASLLALEGRRAEAVEQYRDAFRRYRDLKLSFDGAVIGLDAAKALGVDTPEGASAAAEAREVFERLGAQPFLEIMDRLAVDAAVPTRRVGSRAAEAARP
jgi:class 3 adenylate cyclase/tetratricopeptide (TPR) repeat protein